MTRTISISGVLEYRFNGVDVKVPDAIDIDDEKALMEYLDGTLDYADIRQQSDEELDIFDFTEERPD
jgi:hypothetical protein